MKVLKMLPFPLLLVSVQLSAQSMAFQRYDIIAKSLSPIQPVAYEATTPSDFTDWSFGTLTGWSALPQVAPVVDDSLAGFTMPALARDEFTISSYPIRCAVKLFRKHEGEFRQTCSGMLISENLVLTAAHCVFYDFDDDSVFIPEFRDSIFAVPAYDAGEAQLNSAGSWADAYYIPQQ
ncbi:MAG: trypsin-like serine protease [Deferribacteres bacterium]|nr:trypsin-like serine protease [candidate division KSB1 bacterium]MCB9502161.1 trypsin-like serine protease [Deferribacteres bacterium]